jgi:FkbM family methyltransferase
LRILTHSNAPWAPTGYGQQMALFVPRLRDIGHEVLISSFYGLHGKSSMWHDVHVLPGGLDGYGNDTIWAHANFVKADLVMILVDAWVMAVPKGEGQRTVNITPVDCFPLSKMDEERLKESGATVFAISQYGQRCLADAGIDAFYTPHGIDTKLFAPARNRLEIRDEIAAPPGAFIIGLNAANKDAVRKGFPEQILAFAEFHQRHPNSLLMIHALIQAPGALNLNDIIERSGYPGLKDAIRFTDQYSLLSGMVQPQNLSAWYSSLDLLTNCSFGEGFGLAVVEAQACGTPVVVTDFSAMTELCGSGWMVGSEKFWNGAHRSWWAKPRVSEIVKAYESAWRARESGQMEIKKRRARKFALKYDVDTVFNEYWVPALEAVEKQLQETGVMPAAGNPDIRMSGGLKWRYTDDFKFGDQLALGHEADLEPWVFKGLPADGVFLDIGAHVGHWALRAAKRCKRVIAIEANPETATRLRENIALNDLTNVTVHAVAAWDEETELSLFSAHGHSRDGTANVIGGRPNEVEVGKVPAVRLDVLLASEPRIDVIKIDVEGVDIRVLHGLTTLLDRHQPRLFIEDHSIYGMYEKTDLSNALTELGYQWQDITYGYIEATPKENAQVGASTTVKE